MFYYNCLNELKFVIKIFLNYDLINLENKDNAMEKIY